MVISTLPFAINVFDVEDFGINKFRFINKIKGIYPKLQWDYYDVRKAQIDFIKKNLSEHISEINENFWLDYYSGTISIASLEQIINKLDKKRLEIFNAISPFRKRSIAEFILTKQGDNWDIIRIPVLQFKQVDAQVNQGELKDYRHVNRVFSDTEIEYTDDLDFQKLMKGLANSLANKHSYIKRLNIVAHHTYVKTTVRQKSSNSPEGIHQDGYDYIVSALVIERKNILGGQSIILGRDKKTRLLETILKPGQGLLQADKSTELWHTVEPISVKESELQEGYRSSIGFDINIGH